MKHLLNGVAIAAVFALATPVFAQNAPMTPSTPPKAAPAPAPAAKASAAPMKKTSATMPAKHMTMKKHRHMARMMGGGDQMTEQLNSQELARITGGGAPAPMAPAQPGMAAPPPPAK